MLMLSTLLMILTQRCLFEVLEILKCTYENVPNIVQLMLSAEPSDPFENATLLVNELTTRAGCTATWGNNTHPILVGIGKVLCPLLSLHMNISGT